MPGKSGAGPDGLSQACLFIDKSHRWVWASMIGPSYILALLARSVLQMRRPCKQAVDGAMLPRKASRSDGNGQRGRAQGGGSLDHRASGPCEILAVLFGPGDRRP